MKCRLILTVVHTVFLMEGYSAKDFNDTNSMGIQDRWIWGPYGNNSKPTDETFKRVKVNNTEGAVIETTTEEVDPCIRTEPPAMPDYRALGLRINEIKCREYIWQVNSRWNSTKQNEDCQKYNKKHNKRTKKPSHGVGGRSAAAGEFPHMGALGWKTPTEGTWIFKCGCSLISSKFVMTAAHCAQAPPKDTSVADPIPKIVRLGDKNIHGHGQKRDANIERIIVHPERKPLTKYFDIALMELDREIRFNKNIQPACLWNRFDTSPLGKEATSTGWGVIETVGCTLAPDLQVIVVDIIDVQTCDQLLKPYRNRWFGGVQDDQICAGKLKGGVDACQGDSGGPLQVKIPLPSDREGQMHYVIGITSFGYGCALANTPGIYTRVSTFIDWIENIVWPQD